MTFFSCRYVALEDFENGIRSYQSALRVDARHYNSWYGLGMVYLRQEKFEFSEHHFRMAFLINPHSSVIMSYLGTAMHALKVGQLAILLICLSMRKQHSLMQRFDKVLSVVDREVEKLLR